MSEKKTLKHLLIVEDDLILSAFLDTYLKKNSYQITCINDGDQIPATLDKQRFDAIILDLMLPGRNGLYWLKWIKQYYAHTPVIIISSRANEQNRLQGLKAGARDYVIKPFHETELLIRIGNILNNSQPHSQHLIELGEISLDLDKCRLFKQGQEVALTGIEADILKLFYINAGAVLSRDEISEQIRGVKHQPFDRSIDIHINRLRNKIEDVPAKPLLIKTVRGKGYSLRLPEIDSIN